MTVPDRAVRFVAHWEAGGEPLLQASNALDGVWTIGFGHTEGVKPGDRISSREAWELLRADLRSSARVVSQLVTKDLNEHQCTALISFVYNVGPGAFAVSTLLKRVNRRHWGSKRRKARKIREAFLMWDKAPNGPGGPLVVMEGLRRRRLAEARLFNR